MQGTLNISVFNPFKQVSEYREPEEVWLLREDPPPQLLLHIQSLH